MGGHPLHGAGMQRSCINALRCACRLFLDHKTLYYDVDPFLFYVLCEYDEWCVARALRALANRLGPHGSEVQAEPDSAWHRRLLLLIAALVLGGRGSCASLPCRRDPGATIQ